MKFIKYLLLAFAVPFFTQCTDLDEEPYTFLAPSAFYQDAEELGMAVVSVYDAFQTAYGGSNYKHHMYLEVLTEFGAPAYAKDDVHLWNAWYDINNPSRTFSNDWPRAFTLINRANIVLGRGEGIDMDETLKSRYFAEVRFLRALANYKLVRIFGGLPIPESYTTSMEGLEIPRKSVAETYEHIIADLEFAEANLPLKSAYSANDKWRPSKGAAQAFLGEVYLTRASMEGVDAFFDKSKEYSEKVIQSGEFELEPDFKDLWYWWNTNNKNGKESIFEVQYGQISGEYNNLHVMFGVNITEASIGCYMYRRYGPTIPAYLSYSDDDTRKEGTFLDRFNRTTNGVITGELVFVPEDNGFYPGSQGWNTASPGNIKFYDRTPESASLKMPQANIYVMRYADVLLNYAEAENHINGPTTDALDKINEVRNRANLEDIPEGVSFQELDDFIYRERGWEFIGESQLYFDALRTDRLGAKVQDEWEYGLDNGVYMYKDATLEFVPQKTFLWKIPTYDLDSNPALEQNPDNVSK
ncbi:RagB/SusD family nutrient uptake outer membrane protein [Gaoshiqia sediminis]|uniref:RagB/SusD family nutrient uptake outer membrane protein n=1 Tax=Gaoshiqia sediminis TaxID=2986998 RepID=A0AA41Y645_9BACT|nr:RagB/SusD family nutrient uptake outer membrane protein [Gaoshiqia sediminis]MCW0481822.1 RagB/SusD family nutrient uptake outer membrane protein [Gaoshiqia sediminis]